MVKKEQGFYVIWWVGRSTATGWQSGKTPKSDSGHLGDAHVRGGSREKELKKKSADLGTWGMGRGTECPSV